MTGLYIHVPFCIRKCHYCDFYSLPAPTPQAVLDYHAGLVCELDALPRDFLPETAYVGGGTPTALDDQTLADLLDGIGLVLRRGGKPAVEWTVEANPGTLTGQKLRGMAEIGVTRISLGAQSFDDATLQRLGRIHDRRAIQTGVAMIRDAGIRRLSLDLMYGLPGQTLAQLEADLDALLALEPEHVSVYALSIEPGTPFGLMQESGLAVRADDDTQADQYEFLRQALAAHGFVHYELSNFARPGEECRHNLVYWSGGDYIGCGPAAHSYWRGRRFGNWPDIQRWQAMAAAGGSAAREFVEELDPPARAREFLVLALRRLAGISRAEFRAVTGFDWDTLRGDEIQRLLAQGLLEQSGDTLRLAPHALFISNTVFSELI